jgi:dCMP deaminase
MDYAALLKKAYLFGSYSGDTSTRNGAILVTEAGLTRCGGWNDIPQKVRDLPERRVRPLKYRFTHHAERATISAAAKMGIVTGGLTMVCPWSACDQCALAIIDAGIRRLVRHKIPQHALRADWVESVATGDIMLREAGVEVVDFEGQLGVKFLFDGQEIEV